jgi:predicted Zn-dependent protease
MTENDDTDARLQSDFDEALQQRDAGDLPKAVQAMRQLAVIWPEKASILGTLAGLEFQMGDYEAAVVTGRKATRVAPRSELASLTLFHSLHRLGEADEAFAEMARFRAVRASDEYDKLLVEMSEDIVKRLKETPSDAFVRNASDRITAEMAARPIRH